jgi:hypothetical protein
MATSELTLEQPGSILPFLVMPGSTFIALITGFSRNAQKIFGGAFAMLPFYQLDS